MLKREIWWSYTYKEWRWMIKHIKMALSLSLSLTILSLVLTAISIHPLVLRIYFFFWFHTPSLVSSMSDSGLCECDMCTLARARVCRVCGGVRVWTNEWGGWGENTQEIFFKKKIKNRWNKEKSGTEMQQNTIAMSLIKSFQRCSSITNML